MFWIFLVCVSYHVSLCHSKAKSVKAISYNIHDIIASGKIYKMKRRLRSPTDDNSFIFLLTASLPNQQNYTTQQWNTYYHIILIFYLFYGSKTPSFSLLLPFLWRRRLRLKCTYKDSFLCVFSNLISFSFRLFFLSYLEQQMTIMYKQRKRKGMSIFFSSLAAVE